jgi:hypothetical protein
MGWSARAEQIESPNRIEKAIQAQPEYSLTPPKTGILIELFEPRGRDFGYPPNENMRVKIERITSGYRNETLNAWQVTTNPVGYISIAPDGKLKFSSARLKSELFRLGLEAA